MKQASRCYYGLALILMSKQFGSKPLTAENLKQLDLKDIENKLHDKKMSLSNPEDLQLFGTALLKEGLL